MNLHSRILESLRGGCVCINDHSNLGSLAVAVGKYLDIYGTLPPAYTVDENGKPMHSWRALLLPYLDDTKSISYNYSEPWDSPHNQKFHDKMPTVFRCQCAANISQHRYPSYVMIVGKNTISDGTSCTRYENIKGLNVIIFIEIRNANFNWLEPIDISFDALDYNNIANNFQLPSIGSHHKSPKEFYVLTSGWNRHYLTLKTTSINTIKAMATIDGARTVIEKKDAKTQMKYFEFQNDKSEKK
ncbi:MAG: DUF1559 domain-containing protein [Planctomycetaceae bacterium]|nr:DUF1559 domain-containing protein [Planctomycetaceae bacterium]